MLSILFYCFWNQWLLLSKWIRAEHLCNMRCRTTFTQRGAFPPQLVNNFPIRYVLANHRITPSTHLDWNLHKAEMIGAEKFSFSAAFLKNCEKLNSFLAFQLSFATSVNGIRNIAVMVNSQLHWRLQSLNIAEKIANCSLFDSQHACIRALSRTSSSTVGSFWNICPYATFLFRFLISDWLAHNIIAFMKCGAHLVGNSSEKLLPLNLQPAGKHWRSASRTSITVCCSWME